VIHLKAEKSASVIKPQSVATSATATGNVDRLGYDVVAIDVHLDSQASTTDIPTALQIAESDDTVASNFATVAGLVGGTNSAGGFTIPNSQTVANIVQINIDCRARKRYLQLSFTPGVAAQLVSATARLGRAKEAPTAAAGAGTKSGSALPFNAFVVNG